MTILDFLKSAKGCQFMTISYSVEPKMNKRGNPYFGRVTKISVAQVQYGYSYQNAVNNRTDEDAPEFKAQAMSGAEWLDGYENRLCVSAKGIRARFYRYEGGKSKSIFLIDGRLASESEVAEIKSFMPQRKPSQTQAAVGLIEHQVEPFAIYIDNILSIKGAGQVVTCDSPMLAYCE